MLVCCLYKSSILGIIDALSGPLVAAILCILPMYAIHKVPVLAKYKGKRAMFLSLL